MDELIWGPDTATTLELRLTADEDAYRWYNPEHAKDRVLILASVHSTGHKSTTLYGMWRLIDAFRPAIPRIACPFKAMINLGPYTDQETIEGRMLSSYEEYSETVLHVLSQSASRIVEYISKDDLATGDHACSPWSPSDTGLPVSVRLKTGPLGGESDRIVALFVLEDDDPEAVRLALYPLLNGLWRHVDPIKGVIPSRAIVRMGDIEFERRLVFPPFLMIARDGAVFVCDQLRGLFAEVLAFRAAVGSWYNPTPVL